VSSSFKISASLDHLLAELARIDVVVRRAVWLWQLAGQDPRDAFRGLRLAEDEAASLLERPFGADWQALAELSPDDARAFVEAEACAATRAQEALEEARRRGDVPRLWALCQAFGLDRFDQDVLLLCLAPALDVRYGRLYAFLQDDVTRKSPTADLAMNLLCPPGAARLPFLLRFSDQAPLFQHALLQRAEVEAGTGTPVLAASLAVDHTVVAWLLGSYQPARELAPCVSFSVPAACPEDVLLVAGQAASLDRLAEAVGCDAEVLPDGRPSRREPEGSAPLLAVFHGDDAESQAAGARRLACRAGRPLLTVDLALARPADARAIVRRALRDARLTGALPFLRNWDVCLVSDTNDGGLQRASESRLAGAGDTPELVAELCAFPGAVVITARDPWQPTWSTGQLVAGSWGPGATAELDPASPASAPCGWSGASGLPRLFQIEYPVPGFSQRKALWAQCLGSESEGLAALAGQYVLTSGQIRSAVAAARDRAAQRGDHMQSADLFASARAHSSPGLATLARQIRPRYGWRDIVLPPDQLTLLHEIVGAVLSRPLVFEEWGVGRKLAASYGVTMLFAGPPGTGKTMAAEVIASDLGLELYKIDLSTIVSKYIGETEKNLERIFNEARSSNAILFFDEADAIFGKRSEVKDAHDRYANIEVSYLLQRMEAYDGVTILATNLRANLDEAFTRRLQFAVDFPFPEEEYRLRIWQTLFPPEVPRTPDLDLATLARRFKLAGGSIRNIIVSATFLAAADGQCVGMSHLMHGARRELQKMGRLLNEKDLQFE
jgi:hypothetical protein